MWTLLVVTVLQAAPIELEVMGFSVERDGTVLKVAAVKPGSPASAMKLEPGMTIERLVSPTWLFVGGRPLAKLNDRDLHDALTPPSREPLVLQLKKGDAVMVLTGTRTDDVPDPWETGPDAGAGAAVTRELLERLTTMQMMRYTMWAMNPSATRAPRPRTALELGGGIVARVAGQKIVEVLSGGWTPAWVFFTGRLSYSCESSPMRLIELSSESEAPLPKVVARSNDATLRGSSVEVELPLWRTTDVVAACKTGKNRLASVPFTGFLGCEGKPREAVLLSLELDVACIEAAPREMHRLPLYLERESVVVGEKKPMKVWWWTRSPPAPRAVSVVELDTQRKVVRTIGALSPSENGQWRNDLTFDVTTPRTLSLAAEVRFPDGTVELGDVQPLRIIDEATNAREMAEFKETTQALHAVSQRLFKARPKYCDDPKGTVKWLEAQPEVSHASASEDGHSISFLAKPRQLPMALVCHH